jgi:hypothetical protein
MEQLQGGAKSFRQRIDEDDLKREFKALFGKRPVNEKDLFEAEIKESLSDPAYLNAVFRRQMQEIYNIPQGNSYAPYLSVLGLGLGAYGLGRGLNSLYNYYNTPAIVGGTRKRRSTKRKTRKH